MISTYDIMVIKEDMNHEKLIYLAISRKDFVFRLITIKEYTQAKMLTSTPEEFNDAICQIALIHPVDYNFATSPIAGASDVAAEHIIEQSKIFDSKGVLDSLENARAKINRFFDQCVLLIKAAFTEYTLDEIQDWNYEKLMDMVAKAEFVLKLQGNEVKIECEIEEIDQKESRRKSDAELVHNGIDPMFYYADQIKLKQDFIDRPVILGNNWREEGLIKDVQQQILRRQISKRKLS